MSRPMVQIRNRSRWQEADIPSTAWATSPIAGVGTAAVAAGSEPIQCDATRVALIDEVIFTCQTNDANTTVTGRLHVNGQTNGLLGATATVAPHVLNFHFPGTANAVTNRRIVIRPRGHLVVRPSSTMWVQSSTAGSLHCQVRYRYKSLLAAIRDGDISPNGTIPNVASTNSVTGAGTAAATAKNIIPGIAGKAIEILGLYFTGHSYNAAADDSRIGFWNGATGTFAANGSMFFRAWVQGATARYAPELILDNIDGCIQGPSGEGVYIQSSANLAGNPAPCDYNVIYRYVEARPVIISDGAADAGGSTTTMVDAARTEADNFWNNKHIRFTSGANMNQVRLITAFVAATDTMTFAPAVTGAVGAGDTYDIIDVTDVAMPTGSVGGQPLARKKFWYITEADGGVPITKWFATPPFASGQTLRLKGHAGSVTAADNVANNILGVGIGDALTTLTEHYMFNGDGNAAAAGHVWGRDSVNLLVPMSLDPNFFCLEGGANLITNRFQLAWGTFRSDSAALVGSALVPFATIA